MCSFDDTAIESSEPLCWLSPAIEDKSQEAIFVALQVVGRQMTVMQMLLNVRIGVTDMHKDLGWALQGRCLVLYELTSPIDKVGEGRILAREVRAFEDCRWTGIFWTDVKYVLDAAYHVENLEMDDRYSR